MTADNEAKNTIPKQSIEATLNGPFIVRDLNDLRNSKGERLDTRPSMALCRCGGSANKPFCDGTHSKIDFRSSKLEGRVPDKLDDYKGKEITIHDNRCVCAHSGYCTDNSPAVFNAEEEPWIDPDAESPDKIAKTIEMCPSGALSYTRDGIHHKDQNREPSVIISKNGPYCVVGGPELKDAEGSKPESEEHYSLCRCGGAKNKPFCDGTHGHINFIDDKN